MQEWFRRVADARGFQNGVTGVILVAGVLAGIETYPELVERWHGALHGLDQLVLAVFVGEVVVKMGAEGRRVWRYFLDPWNAFDFFIVVVCFLPAGGSGAAVLRLLRLLRVLKLVRAVPKLQLLVSALLKSIPSMGYVSLLLGLLFYLYGVAATQLFGANDPVHFGRLELSLLSLFRVVTLEGWTELLYIQMYGCDAYGYGDWPERCTASAQSPLTAVAFFVSFVLIGTMVILNLFVGVIMNGMEEAHAEQEAELLAAERQQTATLEAELHDVRSQLDAIAKQLDRLRVMASRSVAAK